MTPSSDGERSHLNQLCINAIRMLSIDAVQRANSGHPGMPMGAATMAFILWTRQPVEQLASLRAMPNMMVLRPSDATETVEAWRIALQHTEGPVGIVLTRQKLPVLDRTVLASASGLAQGAYILAEAPRSSPDVILIATGSEVALALEAHARLVRDGIQSRVVSMPSWELFERQSPAYRDAVLPPRVRARVAIEAAGPFGWERYVGLEGAIIGVARFGASAPGPVVMREFGFTPDHVVETAKARLHACAA